MTPTEAAQLLAIAAAYDRRTVGRADALAWSRALEHITLPDATEAIVEHYRATTDWLMPAHVIQGVRRIRRLRIERHGDPAPNADPDDTAAYRRAIAEGRAAIADGSELRPRPVHALIVGKSLPRPDYGDGARKAREALRRYARERAAEPATQAEATGGGSDG